MEFLIAIFLFSLAVCLPVGIVYSLFRQRAEDKDKEPSGWEM